MPLFQEACALSIYYLFFNFHYYLIGLLLLTANASRSYLWPLIVLEWRQLCAEYRAQCNDVVLVSTVCGHEWGREVRTGEYCVCGHEWGREVRTGEYCVCGHEWGREVKTGEHCVCGHEWGREVRTGEHCVWLWVRESSKDWWVLCVWSWVRERSKDWWVLCVIMSEGEK